MLTFNRGEVVVGMKLAPIPQVAARSKEPIVAPTLSPGPSMVFSTKMTSEMLTKIIPLSMFCIVLVIIMPVMLCETMWMSLESQLFRVEPRIRSPLSLGCRRSS
mgnify:CR=1 FL=1